MNENKVLATIDGIKVRQEDLDKLMQNLDPQSAAQFRTNEGQKKLLSEVINQKMFLLEAYENNMDKEEAFQAELDAIKDNVLAQYAVRKQMDNIMVDTQEIEEFYKDNQQYFIEPESIRASHILVDDEASANKILQEINNGLSYEKAANTYSKCPSGKNGGDLGYFTIGKMVQEFEAAAFSMSIGEISKPVKTQFGYHIIKLVDRKAPETKALDEVKERISQHLTSMKQNDYYARHTQKLKEKYTVKIYE